MIVYIHILWYAGLAQYFGGRVMAAAASHIDIFDLSRIYNKEFSYSLPQEVLEKYLSGKAFDASKEYTAEEAFRIKEDVQQLFSLIMEKNPMKKPLAVLSAGAPGAGKTILIRQILDLAARKGEQYQYICPDDVCLKNMHRTFNADIEASKGSVEARTAAYAKYRPASNAVSHLLLANAIREKFAFFFGTTCSSPKTPKFLEFLKEQGYQIKIIHVNASDDVRWQSIQERDKTFIQTTQRDVREKGGMVADRIYDTFLRYADEIEFYYRSAVDSNAIHAATWMRVKSRPFGKLEIIHRQAYEAIKNLHNSSLRPSIYLGNRWENSVGLSEPKC